MKLVPDSVVYAIESTLAKTASVIKGNLYLKLSDWDLARVFFERVKKLSPIPTPPTTKDPANFDERADIFLSSLPNLQIELNEMIDELNKINADNIIINNNLSAINLDFKPNLEKAKEYINDMLIKIELLRNDYEKNTAVLAGDNYTYSKEYLDDMFSKCVHILNHYTKFEIDTILKDKEEKNKELFYLKSQIDEMLKTKVNADEIFKKAEIYTKKEIDEKLSKKANNGDSYKKAETYSINELYTKKQIDEKIKEVNAYKKAESDKRFLGINAKAKDSDLLDGLDSSAFARASEIYSKKESDSRYVLSNSTILPFGAKAVVLVKAGVVVKNIGCEVAQTTKNIGRLTYTMINIKLSFAPSSVFSYLTHTNEKTVGHTKGSERENPKPITGTELKVLSLTKENDKAYSFVKSGDVNGVSYFF